MLTDKCYIFILFSSLSLRSENVSLAVDSDHTWYKEAVKLTEEFPVSRVISDYAPCGCTVGLTMYGPFTRLNVSPPPVWGHYDTKKLMCLSPLWRGFRVFGYSVWLRWHASMVSKWQMNDKQVSANTDETFCANTFCIYYSSKLVWIILNLLVVRFGSDEKTRLQSCSSSSDVSEYSRH